MNEPTTPAHLARDLGKTQQRIRDFLRANYGKLVRPVTHWELTDAQVDAVRTHFLRR